MNIDTLRNKRNYSFAAKIKEKGLARNEKGGGVI